MIRYDNGLIEEIKSSVNIVDIISGYVALKRKGRNYFGLCPFHNEKSPSFSVSETKQIFHCFGCGAGGDAIGFIKKIENIEFKEALEILADRANISLPQIETSEEDKKRMMLQDKVFEVNKFAAEYYHENLYKSVAKLAQEYVKKRKLDNNTLKKFQIGFSGNFDELYKELKKEGFQDEEIFESKLVLMSKNGMPNDAFKKRLMFPIKDVKDRVIAFGGRALDDSKPKYINSPDTVCYNKGRNLYALNVAKKTEKDFLIMVEGYMDAVSLHQRGIDNAVASLGTALTEKQGRLLKRYKSKIIIGYDSDGAGQEATMRGLEILQNIGYDIRILQLEGAKDPDEFVIKYGSGRFNLYVQNAISLVEFKVKKLKQNLDLNQTNDKIKFLNEVSKILLKVDNDIEKEVYVDKISEEYGISKEAIYAQLNKLKFANSPGQRVLDRPASIKNTEEVKIGKQNTSKNEAKENLIILLLINEGQVVYQRIKEDISPNDFKDEKNKKIAKVLYEELEKGDISNVIGLFEKEEELVSHITYILSKELDITDVNKAIDELTQKFIKEKLLEEKSAILKELISGNLSTEETRKIENRLKDISKKLVSIK
ncbi:MAG: DNA primase [Clostridia bacterium]|nr:DNA primase [Clostridia bacterium]